MKRKVVIALLAAAVFIGGFFFFRSKKLATNTSSTVVQRGEVSQELVLTGEIAAREYVNLRFLSSGELDRIYVSEGQMVKKGQYLAQLDTVSLNSTYEKAKSDLRDAQASLEKVHDDVKNHSGDETFAQKETRTSAEVAKDKAYESVIIAEKNLKNALLKAPFKGVVANIESPKGISILATEGQIEIVNPDTFFFEVLADQSEVTKLTSGQEVKIVLDSFPQEIIGGTVEYVSLTPAAEDTSVSYEVRISFDDSALLSKEIRMGMSGDAKFILETKADVLFVPPGFVNSDTIGTFVKKNKKKNGKIYIETGVESEERIEIKGNIKEGDAVYD